MGFNILGAIGGAVGGFFAGGPVGAVVGGIGGAQTSSGASATDQSGLLTGNPLLPMIPPAQDSTTALLGQGPKPIEDLGAFDPSSVGDLNAETPGAMASVADYS